MGGTAKPRRGGEVKFSSLFNLGDCLLVFAEVTWPLGSGLLRPRFLRPLLRGNFDSLQLEAKPRLWMLEGGKLTLAEL